MDRRPIPRATRPATRPAEAAGRRQLDWYLDQERRGRIGIVRSIDDLGRREGLQVVLLMECADPIRSPEDAAWWVARGVRLVGMSWGRGSRYAGGNATPGPLTASGRELVSTLDDLGVGHDASHLSRASFDDLLERSTGPVCATHSNAAALIGDDPRHLLDDQIRAIGDRDGIVGLNLFGRFLAKDRRATLADCLDHVEHAASIIGRRRLALGSDADGGFDPTSFRSNSSDSTTSTDSRRGCVIADGRPTRSMDSAGATGFAGCEGSTPLGRLRSDHHHHHHPGERRMTRTMMILALLTGTADISANASEFEASVGFDFSAGILGLQEDDDREAPSPAESLVVDEVATANESEEELAKQAQNPVADLISLPFQNNMTFPTGPGDDVLYVLNIQPVIPISLNDDWNVITRTIIPVTHQPGLAEGLSSDNGLGDLQFSAFLSPADAGELIWGGDRSFVFPRRAVTPSAPRSGAGPSLVALTSTGPMGDRRPRPEHLVVRRGLRPKRGEPVPDPALPQLQPSRRVVPHVLAHDHRRLEADRRSMDGAARWRHRQDPPDREAPAECTGPGVLQRREAGCDRGLDHPGAAPAALPAAVRPPTISSTCQRGPTRRPDKEATRGRPAGTPSDGHRTVGVVVERDHPARAVGLHDREVEPPTAPMHVGDPRWVVGDHVQFRIAPSRDRGPWRDRRRPAGHDPRRRDLETRGLAVGREEMEATGLVGGEPDGRRGGMDQRIGSSPSDRAQFSAPTDGA